MSGFRWMHTVLASCPMLSIECGGLYVPMMAVSLEMLLLASMLYKACFRGGQRRRFPYFAMTCSVLYNR